MQSSTKTERTTGFVNNIAGNLRALAEAWVFGEERQATTAEPTPCKPDHLIALGKQDCEYLGWLPAGTKERRPGAPVSRVTAFAVLERLDHLENVDTWKIRSAVGLTEKANARVCPECGDTPDDTCAVCDEKRPQGAREQAYAELCAPETETRHARLIRLAHEYRAQRARVAGAVGPAADALACAVLAE